MQRSWISCPIGSHILWALCKNTYGNKRYEQVNELLTSEKGFVHKTKVYSNSSSHNELKYLHLNKSVEVLDLKNFEQDVWIQKNKFLNEFINKFFTLKTKFALTYINSYQNKFSKEENSMGALMKVYNSFNYTEDIQYDARLLELPMRNTDFKFIIITPNEIDVLHTLFNTLISQGLKAATASIHPLFISTCRLDAPYMKFNSQFESAEIIFNQNIKLNKAEIGSVKIDYDGVLLNVHTYIIPTDIETSVTTQSKIATEHPFYFSLVYKDTPIYIGKYKDIN